MLTAAILAVAGVVLWCAALAVIAWGLGAVDEWRRERRRRSARLDISHLN